MHLLPLRAKPARDHTPLASQEPMHPRLAAIRLLAEKIADGQAGLDPYEPDGRIFIVKAAASERTWAVVAVALCGHALTVVEQQGGGLRLRCVLEADVRLELGLDRPEPPLMDDEPLASRRVGAPTVSPLDAILRVLPQPALRLVADDDPTPPAMRDAMAAAQHSAALRVDCGCGAPAGLECRCPDEQRLATTPERQVH